MDSNIDNSKSDQTAPDFWAWFDTMKGDLTVRQVENRAGSPRGRISNAYAPKKKPSLLMCQTIAAGLNLDVVEVLKKAGLPDNLLSNALPSSTSQEESLADLLLQGDSGLAEMASIFRRLKPDRQHIAIQFVKWLLLDQQKNVGQAVAKPALTEPRYKSLGPVISTGEPFACLLRMWKKTCRWGRSRST